MKSSRHVRELQRKSLTPNFVIRPRIWETTLRDGQQTDGVTFSAEARKLIATRLRTYGVDVIEAGSACKGKAEAAAIRGVCEALGSGASVASFARVVEKDIDAVASSGARIIGLVYPASDLHIGTKLKSDRAQALVTTLRMVEYALGNGLQVELLAEDASRANPDFLAHVGLEAQKLGIRGFSVCDTVGVLMPEQTAALFEFLGEAGVRNLSFHGHNDMGLAVANTLAALHAGASGFHGTINGLGERCGNCPVEQVALSLQLSYGVPTVQLDMTNSLSQFVAGLANARPAANQPVVGSKAFAHKAGIHIDALAKGGGDVYEPYEPSVVGAGRLVTISAESGLKGVKYKLGELGVELPEDKHQAVLDRIRELGDVSNADFLLIVEVVRGEGKHEKVTIVDLQTHTSTKGTPTASVFLRLNGDREDRYGSAPGDGPVDAAVKAINNALGSGITAELTAYHVDAITGGSDASVRVHMDVRVNGKAISSSAMSTNIVDASVDAYVKALNVLL